MWSQHLYVYLADIVDSRGKYTPVQQCKRLGLLQYLLRWQQQRMWQLLCCQRNQLLRNSLHQSRKAWPDLSQHHDILPGIDCTKPPRREHNNRSGKLRMV
jgi:hypothetical protein